jgi:hypothetical protein
LRWRRWFLLRWLFTGARNLDHWHLLKLQRRYVGEAGLDRAELARLTKPPWPLRIGSFLRRRVYRWLRRR